MGRGLSSVRWSNILRLSLAAAASLSLGFARLSRPEAAAQGGEYRLIVAARPTKVCVRPQQSAEIRAIVIWEDGKKLRRVPDVGVVVEGPHFGSISPPSNLTSGPLRFAKFTYLAIREGHESLVIHAVGKNPANGNVINLSAFQELDIVRCSYKLSVVGWADVTGANGAVMEEFVHGAGTAQVKDDFSLAGGGTLTMGQDWGLPQQICRDQSVQASFPFTIQGTVSPEGETVHFSLTFSGNSIPAQSQQVKCDTGGGSSLFFNIPLWPVGPDYLPIREFDARAGQGVLEFDYPIKGEDRLLKVFVQLAQKQ